MSINKLTQMQMLPVLKKTHIYECVTGENLKICYPFFGNQTITIELKQPTIIKSNKEQ